MAEMARFQKPNSYNKIRTTISKNQPRFQGTVPWVTWNLVFVRICQTVCSQNKHLLEVNDCNLSKWNRFRRGQATKMIQSSIIGLRSLYCFQQIYDKQCQNAPRKIFTIKLNMKYHTARLTIFQYVPRQLIITRFTYILSTNSKIFTTQVV